MQSRKFDHESQLLAASDRFEMSHLMEDWKNFRLFQSPTKHLDIFFQRSIATDSGQLVACMTLEKIHLKVFLFQIQNLHNETNLA